MSLELQRVSEICNNLHSLIPVGTLLVYGLEYHNYGYEGVPVNDSNWKWLDPWFLDSCIGDEAGVHVRALSKLLSYRFFVATYRRITLPVLNKLCKTSGKRPMALCKIRLYAVPSDIDGARFVRQWRTRLAPEARLPKVYAQNWSRLREVVDFSPSSWDHDTLPATIVIVPLTGGNTLPSGHLDPSHTRRWLEGLPFGVSPDIKSRSLDDVVKRVYDSIRSPDLSKYRDEKFRWHKDMPSSEETIKGLVNLYYTNECPINGITSTLYPFQLHSVCKMFEKESSSHREPIPNFTEVPSPAKSSYFVDLFTMTFYRRPELFLLPKGGILAENMGLGKTLISLSLICLTKHQFSSIPQEAILHEDQSSGGTINEERRKAPGEVKSLWELCRDVISQESLPWKYFEQDLPMSVIDKLSRRPGFFKLPLFNSRTQLAPRGRHASATSARFRVLYLCHTTLVIVPENLLHQWHSEMLKHVESGFLKALFISGRFSERMEAHNTSYTNTLPTTPQQLIQNDLVVISIPVFVKSNRSESSILKEIHWKRLIIDEGHSMGLKATNLSADCESLSCERVWAVTGTPTTGLTNLHMNEDESNNTMSPSKKKKYTVKNSFSVKDDLARLGNIASHFLKIEPYYSQPRLWNSIFVKSLTSESCSTEASLSKLLNVLLIRHNLADVEKDLKLPQLHHEAVYLAPSYHNKLAINLFTAVLAVNAISSEREGSDYMFDSSNHSQLRKLVNNLQLATFYWTGFEQQDVESLIKIAEHCLKKEHPSGQSYFSSSDRRLLERSIAVSTEALRNSRWRTASALHEMLYFVEGLPSQFVKHFGSRLEGSISLFGAPHLGALQKFFYKNRFLKMADAENLEKRLAEISVPFWDRYWQDLEAKEGNARKRHPGQKDVDSKPERTFIDATVDPASSALRSKQNIAEVRYNRQRGGGQLESNGSVSDYGKAKILGTASTKLSYLATRLVENQRAGLKSIVFFEYEDSAYYLSEFLDIIGVNYILYATFIGSSQRANNIIEFDRHDARTDGGISLIMDLRLAAHGLTVISATRVYFMSPVWHRSREAQAIKRAHRIGQTQEVYVETLVLQGTLEEEIYKRRAKDESQDVDKGSKHEMIDDVGMQRYFLKHGFLSTGENEPEHASFTVLAHPELGGNEIDDGSVNEGSLLSHKATTHRVGDVVYNDWTMRVFTPENLEKLNTSVRQKPTKAESNKELLSMNLTTKRRYDEHKRSSHKRRRVEFR